MRSSKSLPNRHQIAASVLFERNAENEVTLQQQKRKVNKLRDALASVMSRYAAADKAFKSENKELTAEVSAL